MPEKQMNILLRSATQEQVRETEAGSRKFTFIASDASRDTAGTVLNQDGWKLTRFNSNGIIGYQHKVYGGYDDTANPDNVIGKGRAYVKDGKLYVDVELEPAEVNELAEKIYKKLLFGSLKAVSVGFMPVGRGQWGKGDEALDGKNPTYYYAGQELLEVSIVNIPANPNALKKGHGFVNEELEALKEEARAEEPEQNPEPTPEPQPDDQEKAKAAERAAKLQQTLTLAGASLQL